MPRPLSPASASRCWISSTDSQRMKIGIIGGGGCFALAFARHLSSLGIDHFGIGRSGPKANPFWLAPKGYRYWKLHLVTSLPAIMGVLDTERPDVVVNFAAQGEGAASFGDNAPDFYTTNVWALARLARELQQRTYLKRFVQIGTSELYGSTEAPAKETDPLRPTSPYAISKAAFDQHLQAMHKIFGFPMNIVRPSNCIVEGQQLYRIVPKTIVCALGGQKLKLHGGGVAQKSYLHADDLAKAVMAVIGNGAVGKTYNVAPAGPTSIRKVVEMTLERCGVPFEQVVEETADRPGQDARYALDTTDIARDCGWTQTVGLGRALDRMVEWGRSYPEIWTMPTDYQHRA
jgi:dTDP-glucose 4,6-dehydratase